jgi:hypothetical protein
MARLTTPDAPDVNLPGTAHAALDAARDSVDQARRSLDSARSSLDTGSPLTLPEVDLRKAGKSIRRTVGEVVSMAADALPDRAPDVSAAAEKVPSRADVMAAVPGALGLAKRMPSMREVRSAVDDARASAADAAVDVARRTPLRDHPAVRRGPGPLGIAVRLVFAWGVAACAALLIVNRDRVRAWFLDARTRAARLAASRGTQGDWAGAGTWSSGAAGGATEVDEVVLVETISPATDEVLGSSAGVMPTTDQPAEDLDAAGWGTAGRPTAPRTLSGDVASMTTPSPAPDVPENTAE